MTLHGIVIQEQRIAEFYRGHGICSLRLFGSILRGDFGPDSDMDVLVEFAPGRAPVVDRLCRSDAAKGTLDNTHR